MQLLIVSVCCGIAFTVRAKASRQPTARLIPVIRHADNVIASKE
jgi:hypothetical protein